MLEWIDAHSGSLQALVGGLTALVWVVYLQLILAGLARQRRTQIMVNRGAGAGLDARCFIANLGLEPIYVAQLLVAIEEDGARWDAVITDRRELSAAQTRDPRDAANQGPLDSGASFDAGSFDELVGKARSAADRPGDRTPDRIEIVVIAICAASAAPAAASRVYRVERFADGPRLAPETLDTRQIRGRRRRKALTRKIARTLRAGGA